MLSHIGSRKPAVTGIMFSRSRSHLEHTKQEFKRNKNTENYRRPLTAKINLTLVTEYILYINYTYILLLCVMHCLQRFKVDMVIQY